jgi:hypothetical protein
MPNTQVTRTLITAIVLSVVPGAIVAASPATQWKEKIICPAGSIHRDIHQVNSQGREEYCEVDLPGSLVIKDGPYRFWLSDDDRHPTTGNYRLGREIGTWNDCDRFNRCSSITHDAPFPEERKRGAFRPEIPVRYVQGEYRFDFGSCRSTWITQRGGPEDVSLNIGGSNPYRCVISFLPQHFIDGGGDGSYSCFIPYSVGTRSFPSLDLMREFPRAGLPQFCQPQSTSAEPLMISEGSDGVAYSTDVICASFRHRENGNAVLALQLNPIVTDLVIQTAAVRGPLNTSLCSDPIEGPQIVREINGTVTLALELSADKAKARTQQKCIRGSLPIKADCALPKGTVLKP